MMASRMKICPSCGLVYPEESNFCFLSGDSLRQAEDPMVGTTIDGRFRADRRMAVGPLATLYAGRDRLLRTPCVIKVWSERLHEAPRAHFLEAVVQALPALRNPTTSQLSNPDWIALETIIDESVVREIIPQRKALGAEGIVEYPLNKVVY